MENYGEVWLSNQVHSNGEAVPGYYSRLARVQNDGAFSDPFPVTNGVKQGFVLAQTLFSMMLSALLTAAFQDGENCIPIRYRFDGKLFNLRSLQVKFKVQTEVLDEFLLVDDMAKGAPTEEKMQKDVDQVSDSCDSFDVTTSTWQALQGAQHYSERSKIASGRQVHLPWKHIFKSRAH